MRKLLAILALLVPLTLATTACEQEGYEEGVVEEE